MNEGLIPRRYAMALYKLTEDHGNSDEVYEEMKMVAGSFAQNPDMQKLLSNPFVERGEKAKLLVTAAGGDVEHDYRSFVDLILNNERAQYASLMALAYCDIFRRAHHIARVRIITASKLGDDEMKKLRNLVEKAYPGMKLDFSEVVDKNLIGGFIIDVDDQRFDASISNEIEQLRLKLLRSN